LKVLDEIYGLGNERTALEDDQKAIDYAEHIANAFSDVKIDFGRTRSDYLAYRAFETDAKGARQFAKIAGKSGIRNMELNVRRTGKKGFLVLIAYEKTASIDDFFRGIRVNELDLTAKYIDSTPAELLGATSRKRADDLKRAEQINKRLVEISRAYYSRLGSMKEMLEIELARSDASAMFKRTDRVVIIEGWVEKRNVEEVRQRISRVTKGKLHVEELEGDELAPTQTHRPKFLQPFDYLVSFYSVQRSDEIDPTWIFILSFPIFYGLMVSDVGYGVASFILATFIAKKTNPEGLMYNAARIWQLNAIAAIFFGILSNQYFGFKLPYYTGVFDWLGNAPLIIAITILFGVAQVILGLAIGIINSWDHGHRKLAYARFTSILVVFFGTVAVAGLLFGVFGAQISEMSAGIAAASFALTLIWSGEEATEAVNLITHPLSYARLMGFGLASVMIALLINMSFTPNLNGGIIVFLIYAVIFIALHFLNMTLSIFEGLVQGVRLNFVEFFSKFYIGNGISFRPFSYKRIYTKE
jgi:V/A-type H+-transporting ATPase subunit I